MPDERKEDWARIAAAQPELLEKLLRPLGEFDLSNQVSHCLSRGNIAYVGDLVKRSEQEVQSLEYAGTLGIVGIDKIREAILKPLVLTFSMAVPFWPHKNAPLRDEVISGLAQALAEAKNAKRTDAPPKRAQWARFTELKRIEQDGNAGRRGRRT